MSRRDRHLERFKNRLSRTEAIAAHIAAKGVTKIPTPDPELAAEDIKIFRSSKWRSQRGKGVR